jgi:hypothetical protein
MGRCKFHDPVYITIKRWAVKAVKV